MLYVYCARPSDSAIELARALGGTRLRNFDGMDFWKRGKRLHPTKHDMIVCWGADLPQLDGVPVLNGVEHSLNKMKAAQLLSMANVPTITIVENAGPSEAADAIQGGRWVGRLNHHVGGNDLLNPPKHPDYLVQRLSIQREYRIHSFGGKSIRAGVKVPREGMTPHEWIRSYDGGWRIDYTNFQSTKQQRAVAHKAVKALGLTFGAVDLGELPTGKLMVLEVNRAPGLEGNSIAAYATAIKKWLSGEKEKVDENE